MTQDANQPDPNTQGDGEPGSSAGGDRGPVPYDRFAEVIAERNEAKAKADRLEGQVEGLMVSQGRGGSSVLQPIAAPVDAPKPTRVLTKPDLDQLVLEGKVSQSEADRLWEKQIETNATNAAVERISSQTRAKELEDKADEAAARYRAVRPSIWDTSSPDRQKLQAEFDRLVSEGADGSNPMTQIHAMEAAFGKVEFLEAAKHGQPGHETHVEMGGGGAAPAIDTGENQDGSPRGLTKKERSHYKGMISKGYFKDWNDPNLKAELKHRNPERAQRLAAL